MGDRRQEQNTGRHRATSWLRNSFPAKLAVSMVFVLGLSLLLTSLLISPLVRDAMRDSLDAEVRALQRTSALQVEQFLAMYEGEFRVMSTAPRLLAPDPKLQQGFLAKLHDDRPAIRWIGLVDPRGTLIAASDGSRGQDFSRDAVFLAGSRQLSISEAQPSREAPHRPVLFYSGPVLTADGTQGGVLIAEIDLSPLLDNLSQARIRNSGETYLLRGDGTLISESRFIPGSSLRLDVETKGSQAARAGQTGLSTYRDYRDISVIGAYAPIRVSERIPRAPRWALLSEIDQTEALAPVKALNWSIALILLLMLGLVSLLVTFVSRQVSAPLLELKTAAERISSGSWGERVRIDSSDEFGELGASFNRMAEQVEAFVTAQKQNEQLLCRALTLLQAEQEASIDGILVLDEHGRIGGYNRQFFELFGLPTVPVGAEAHAMHAMLLTRFKEPLDQVLARANALRLDPDTILHGEVELVDGRVFDRYTAPVISSTGEHFGRIYYYRDISERKRLDATLREQFAKLQELDRMKNDFVNAVSHDLRTPLTSIFGYTEFLEDEIAGPLNTQQLGYVAQIEKSSQRLSGLVNDLLDFARLEAGTFRLERHPFDLAQKIQEVVDTMQPQINEAKLRVELALPEAAPLVDADAERMSRVVTNLLSNAIKFTPAGGRIRIEAHVAGSCFVCQVADTGIGIAPEDQPKLFKRFSQLDSGLRHKGGTGLGLSICKTIVEAHGGSIGVLSERGKGATFWFQIPLKS